MSQLTHGNSQERYHNLDARYPHERGVNATFNDPIVGAECQAEREEVLQKSAENSKLNLSSYLEDENASEGFNGNIACGLSAAVRSKGLV